MPEASRARTRRPPDLRTRTVRCRRCGAQRALELAPEWDRQTFVEVVCPRCSARGLLPTSRLRALQFLGALAFLGSVIFVIHTLLQARH